MKTAHIQLRQYTKGKLKGKYDYKLIAANGYDMLYETRQGFDDKRGMIKNIKAVTKYYCGDYSKIKMTWI